VLTQHNDNARTGAYTNETTLTPANVNASTFGHLFNWTFSAPVYAQPLYVSKALQGADGIIIATEDNQVCAYKAQGSGADTPASVGSWCTGLGTPYTVQLPPGARNVNIWPTMGITSTPVIDPVNPVLYVVAAVAAPTAPAGLKFTLSALNVQTGALLRSVDIDPSFTTTVGGVSTKLDFAPNLYVQRAALTLVNGRIYIGFGSLLGDFGDYHGWIVSYNAISFIRVASAVTSQNAGAGGVWQSGGGFAADTSGNLFVTTGNANVPTTSAYLENSLIKFNGDLAALSHFAETDEKDLDFGSSGAMLIPSTNLVVAGGKRGILHVFDQSDVSRPSLDIDVSVRELASSGAYHFNGSPVSWNGSVFMWPGGGRGVAVPVTADGKSLDLTPANTTMSLDGDKRLASTFGPGLSISANGKTSGILWVDAGDLTSATLAAYDASDISRELYRTDASFPEDVLPGGSRFGVPTVAGGRVFVPVHSMTPKWGSTMPGYVAVYGLLPVARTGATPPPPSMICPTAPPPAVTPSWNDLYTKYFGPSALPTGCVGCHMYDVRAKAHLLITGTGSAADVLAAFEGANGNPVLVDTKNPASSRLIDPSTSPLRWLTRNGNMPAIKDVDCNAAAMADIRAWVLSLPPKP
jgi:hypothetical protein